MGLEFRLLDDDGVEVASLPDVESFSLSPVICDRGAIEFSYPRGGRSQELIDGRDEFRVAVYIDGVRQQRLDAWMQQIDGDDISDAPWKFTGHFGNGRLAEAVVYPKNWPAVDPTDTKVKFLNASPGTIVKTLVQQAQARGTLTEVTTASFSSALDSNGQPWDYSLDMEYAPQVDYLTVFGNLYAQRVAEFEMVGNDLRLYLFQSMAQDLTLSDPPLVFRKGADLQDSPRKISSRELGTVVLAAGTEGVYVERVDAPGVATRRRIERPVSSGQVSDLGTLTTLADAQLDRVSQAKMEKTHGLAFADENGRLSPRPLRDFNVGDWAYSDMGLGALERLRVKQWVMSLNAAGELTGSVSLNDLFAEQTEVLTRRIEGVVGGSTITGGSQAVEVVPGDLVDGLAPANPDSPVLSSSAYRDDQGHTFAQVSASWLQVTTNSDGTILEDLEGYRVRWQILGETQWRVIDVGNTLVTSWSPVVPNVDVNVQVQAYDRAGNSSGWSGTQVVHTAFDATPPEAPSTPLLDNYLGMLRIRYDGHSASGAALAPDINVVQVHISTTNNFTPSASTLIDTLSARTPGVSFATVPYGVPYYAKFEAVDHSGNVSAPSSQASLVGGTAQVVSADIFDGAVGTAKLADLAVTNAKINDLAVNNAKIGDVAAGKITAGVMIAAVTVSGRLTTALTGQRTELNALGLQGWDAAGNQTMDLNGFSNLLTGRFRTAISGRRIDMGATGQLGEISFYAPNTARTFMRAYTESSGIEAIQFGVETPGGSSSLWNRINYNSDEWANYQTNKHHFFFGRATGEFVIFDSTAVAAGSGGVSRLGIGGTTLNYWDNTGQMRMYVDNTWNIHEIVNDGVFRVQERNGSVDEPRFTMLKTQTWWEWPETSSRLVFISPGARNDLSGVVQLANGYNFVAQLRYLSTSAGASSRLEVRDAGSGYVPIQAGTYTDLSRREAKTDIADFDGDATAMLRSVPVRKFRLRGPTGRRDLFVQEESELEDANGNRRPGRLHFEGVETFTGEEGPEQIGVIVDEVPPEWVTTTEEGAVGVQYAAQIATLIKSFQEMDQRVAQLERGKPA